MALTAHAHKMTRLDSGPPKELYCEVDGCDYRERVPERPESLLPPKEPPARERPGAPQTPGAPKPSAPMKKPTPSPILGKPAVRPDDDDL